MKLNLKRLLLTIILFVTTGICLSQSGEENNFNSYYTDPYANITPQTPNASNFTIYGNTPVNTSSGLPNITIPIYTIEMDGVQIPITLTYHASGIKVDDISSSVGLKWTLNAGGGIFRTVNNQDDFKDGKGWVNGTNLSHFDTWLNTHPQFDYNNGDQQINILSPFIRDYDMWPDDFNFNFLGFSGNFMFKPDGSIITSTDNKLIISDDLHSNGYLKGFVVNDYNGNYYFFNNNIIEKNLTLTRFYVENETNVDIVREEQDVSWMLNSIITKNGKEISFEYIDFSFNYDRHPISQRLVSSYYCNYSSCILPMNCTDEGNSQLMNDKIHATGLFNESSNKLIKKIHAENVEVEFFYTDTPIDGNIIDGWDMRIERIVITDLLQSKEKVFQLNHSFFNNSNYKRLKLTEIYEKGFDGAIKPPYTFTYNETRQLPNPGSFSKDYKGYFNGKNNASLFPKTPNTLNYKRVAFNPSGPPVIIHPAYEILSDRNYDEDYLKTGILTEIKYPTGGKTNFIYEPNAIGENLNEHKININNNSISNQGYPYSTDGLFKIYSVLVNFKDVVGKININSFQDCPYCDLDPPDLYVPIFRVHKYFGNINDPIDEGLIGDEILRGTLSNGSKNYLGFTNQNQSIEDLDGIYVIQLKIRIELFDEFPNLFVLADFTWNNKLRDQNNNFIYNKHYFGGLRIKEIKDYDVNNLIYNHKKFNYINGVYGDYSDLMTSENIKTIANQNIFSTERILLPGSQLIDGYYYSEVETIFLHNNSKIVEKFSGLNSFKSINGGDIEERNIFNNLGDTLQIENYDYNFITNDTLSFMTPTLLNNPYQVYFQCTTNNFILIDKAGYSYPSNEYLFTYNNLVKSVSNKKTTQFFNYGNNLKPVTILQDYEYNDDFLITHEKTDTRYTRVVNINNEEEYILTNPNGEYIEVDYTYPKDYPNELQSLINSHKIALPISKKVKNTGQDILGQYFEYDSNGNIKTTYHYNKGQGSNNSPLNYIPQNYEEMTSFIFQNGKPIQVLNKNGSPTSYIYGYNHQFPVAKIENKAYSSIPTGIISAIQTASDTGTENDLLSALNNLRIDPSMSQAMLTTYTHIPLVGVSTITDPKSDRITYYYDEFGRLDHIIDAQGNLLEEYEYHYGNE